MGRGARDNRDRRPRLHPVERIELNEEHTGRRLIAAAVLLLLGAVLLTYAVTGLLNPELGWQEVEASGSAGSTCAGDFTFLYQMSSRAEVREVTSHYTEACQRAYRLFHSGQEFDGVVNVYAINHHPNETLEVDPGLYAAFSAVVESGRRELYLGPVYERYDDLFYCQDDAQLVDFDPRLSEDVLKEYAEVLVYANDPEAIGLELLGENRVRLNVSAEYLSWANQQEIDRFLDFAWMGNAFAADYLAEELSAKGYTKGILTSYDGFARNLDDGGTDYAYTIYHRRGDMVYPAASLNCRGPMSFVRMRDYPLSEQDAQHYYRMATGEVRTFYLDAADALCKSAVDTLVCYSREKGCAQVLLEMIPVYIADSFRPEAFEALSAGGIASIYCEDGVLYPSEADATLTQLYEKDGVRYSVASPESK